MMNSIENLYHSISIPISIVHLRSSVKIAPADSNPKLVPSKPPHIDSLVILRTQPPPPKRINSLAILHNLFTFHPKNILLCEADRDTLQAIMKRYPKIFQELDEALMSITRKGRLQLHDIPQVVFIVYSVFRNHRYIVAENALNIIKFMVESILDSFDYPFSMLENEIVAKQTVLGTSFALLEAKLPAEAAKTFWGKYFFRK